MDYRCEVTSETGFVQQLVSCYLPHGYWFYVSGWVPFGKDPKAVDAKLLEKYGIDISRSSRARRKGAGLANVHYLRFQRQFILLATHGRHPFFAEEEKNIRDVRHAPIQFAGYSIGVKPGGYLRKTATDAVPMKDTKSRVHVQIAQKTYRELKDFFLEAARRRAAAFLVAEFRRLPYEPYAPVRQQLLNILRLVNEIRHRAGRMRIDAKTLRYRRRIVRPFDIAFAGEDSKKPESEDLELPILEETRLEEIFPIKSERYLDSELL